MSRRKINRLNNIPLMYEVENFMSPEEVAHFLSLGDDGMSRAQVSDIKKGRESKSRTNRVRWIAHDHTPVLQAIADRASALVGIPLTNAEKFQLIHYNQSQEYRAHYDAFDPNIPRGKRNWVRGGQRLVTLLVYLNHVEAGGHTDFPNLELSVAPTPGKAVIFHNCYPNTNRRHPLTLHAGAPVVVGHKWAFNLWFRESDRSKKIQPPVH
jgi:prolyl 4-hydroxylase